MRFRDLNLRTKQLISFSLILIVVLVASAFIIHRMTLLKNSFDEVATNWMPRSAAIADLSRGISNCLALALQHSLSNDLKQKSTLEKLISLQIGQIQDFMDSYEALREQARERGLLSATEDSLYQAFDSDWDEYQSLFQEWFLKSQQNENEATSTLIASEGAILLDNIHLNLDDLVENINLQALAAANKAEELNKTTRQVLAVLLAVAIFLSGLIGLIMTRLITDPLKKLAEATESVSQGNLELQLDLSGKDEIGSLAQSFERMATSLRDARAKTEQQAEKLRQQNAELELTLVQLHKTQEELLLKEKMASLGKLVASLAHEINSPIGTVISAADVSERALRKLKESLENQIQKGDLHSDGQLTRALSALDENARLTLTASQRIAGIVQNLKIFSQLDEAEFQIVDVHEGIESSLVMLGTKKLSHVKIEKNFGLVPRIGCYPGLLNQALINLISNAVEAIVDSGTISINTSQKGNELTIAVSDTGVGIAQERLKTLFDFGFSADATRVKMGTGLMTAYNIIQKHGGRIEVVSEVGKGSTFSVVLPITA